MSGQPPQHAVGPPSEPPRSGASKGYQFSRDSTPTRSQIVMAVGNSANAAETAGACRKRNWSYPE